MIIDTLENIAIYEDISADIAAGLKFIAQAKEDIPTGTYEITEKAYVIISEYNTKLPQDGRYEAHRNVIDIQYPVKGRETARWAPCKGLRAVTAYNPEKDVTFYADPDNDLAAVLGEGIFAIFFPGDAHKPSLASGGGREFVKKLTVKVKI